MEFARRLKKLRESRNLSMRQAAKRIGVAETTYREWEYGREIRGEPYLKIAETFGVSLEDLLGKPTSRPQTSVDVLDRIIIDMKKLRGMISEVDKK